MLIDSHCHLTYEPMVSDIQKVLDLCKQNQVSKILTIGTNLETSKKSIQIAEAYKNIFCTIGLHPNETEKEGINFTEIVNLARSSKKIIGIGETGLDFYYDKEKEKSAIQIDMFEKHIELGEKTHKPVIVHTRSADKETLEVIKKIKNRKEIDFVIHCFTGNSNFCHKLLDLGCYISFSGIITFNKVEEICKAVEIVPLDKLLVETDSPYLSPVPFRGKKNFPSNVKFVAEKIAQIKKVSFEEIALCTSKNFNKIFSIK
jgi:TatD DNase family protein